MRSMRHLAAVMSLASLGAVVRSDFGDVLVVDETTPTHDATGRQYVAVDHSTKPERMITTADVARIHQAEQRRARKVARQARGFVTSQLATASDASVVEGDKSREEPLPPPSTDQGEG